VPELRFVRSRGVALAVHDGAFEQRIQQRAHDLPLARCQGAHEVVRVLQAILVRHHLQVAASDGVEFAQQVDGGLAVQACGGGCGPQNRWQRVAGCGQPWTKKKTQVVDLLGSFGYPRTFVD
jgi:hypothetical protein